MCNAEGRNPSLPSAKALSKGARAAHSSTAIGYQFAIPEARARRVDFLLSAFRVDPVHYGQHVQFVPVGHGDKFRGKF